MQVQEQVEDMAPTCNVRLTTAGGAVLEAGLEVRVVPAAPHSWTAEAAVAVGEDTQDVDGNGVVKCGLFFRVEVTALDAFSNRLLFGLKFLRLRLVSSFQSILQWFRTALPIAIWFLRADMAAGPPVNLELLAF